MTITDFILKVSKKITWVFPYFLMSIITLIKQKIFIKNSTQH